MSGMPTERFNPTIYRSTHWDFGPHVAYQTKSAVESWKLKIDHSDEKTKPKSSQQCKTALKSQFWGLQDENYHSHKDKIYNHT